MKCPKCSYVSFDYLDECRKCSRDLGPYKAEVGIDFAQPVSLGIIDFLETGSSASAAEVETEFADTDVTVEQVSEPSVSLDNDEGISLELGDDEGRGDEGVTLDVGDAPDTDDVAEIGIELSADEEEPALELGGDVVDSAEDGISLDLSDDVDLDASLDLDDGVDIGMTSDGELSVDEDLPLDLSDASEDSGPTLSMDDDLGGLDMDLNLDDESIDVGDSATDEKDASLPDDDLGGLDLSFDDDDDEVKLV